MIENFDNLMKEMNSLANNNSKELNKEINNSIKKIFKTKFDQLSDKIIKKLENNNFTDEVKDKLNTLIKEYKIKDYKSLSSEFESLEFYLRNEIKSIIPNSDSKILCVTSFNKKLYEKYAYRFLNSYNLPFDLHIYSEEDISFIKKDHKIKNLEVFDMKKTTPELFNFIKRNEKRVERKNKATGSKFRFDAIRFCYKPYAMYHAITNNINNYKYIIWFDSDIVFTKPFSHKFIEDNLINKDEMMSYLGRKLKYSETGFLLFNLRHTYVKNYIKKLIYQYDSDKIFTLKEWHDSYVWDHVRIKCENKMSIKNRNLTKKSSENHHILVDSILNNYIVHLKGTELKDTGVLNYKDLNFDYQLL